MAGHVSTLVAGCCFLVSSCGPRLEAPRGSSPSPPSKTAPSPAAAPLVVALVVDQLAAWLLHDRLQALPNDGGFARLVREGTYVVDMRYAHAATDTAPGHAALFTGTIPRHNGIAGNSLVDPATGERLGLLQDLDTRLVTASGVTDETGVSARLLQTETLADRFLKSVPNALVVSLSLKDRGAVFAAGHGGGVALWFNARHGGFVSSTAFTNELPPWVVTDTLPRPEAQAQWRVQDPAFLQQHANSPDEALGEAGPPGAGASFPHPVAALDHPDLGFRASPYGDHELIQQALAAVRGLPFGQQPGLLTVSLSSTDYVGHLYGPDSWEWWDNFLRLDQELLRLLTELDRELGPEGYAVALTADHGVTSMPEVLVQSHRWCSKSGVDRFERSCAPGGRVVLLDLLPTLEAVASRELGPGHWILTASNPYIYLTQSALALSPPELERLTAALTRELVDTPGIERVIDTRSVPERCAPPSDESHEALVCRSVAQGSGQLYVLTQPAWFLDTGYIKRHGANHGSPRLHDRSVPLIVRAPGRVLAGQRREQPHPFTTFAHTVSALLGMAPPAGALPGPSLLDHTKGPAQMP